MPSDMSNAAGLYFEPMLTKFATKRLLSSVDSIMVIEIFFELRIVFTLIALIITTCTSPEVNCFGFKAFDVFIWSVNRVF